MTILKKRPLRTVALGALLMGAISCGGSSTTASDAAGGSDSAGGGSSSGGGTTTPPVTTTGSTFAFTTGTDKLMGTSGDDTFTGEINSTAPSLNASDTVDGGDGVDTLVLHGYTTQATHASQLPSNSATVKNVEYVRFPTILNNSAHNFTTIYSKAQNGVMRYILDDVSAVNNTFTLGADQEIEMGTGVSGAIIAGTQTVAYPSSQSSMTLRLKGYQFIAGGTPLAVTLTGAAATTLNIHSSGNENKIGTFTVPTNVTKYVVTGDKKFTAAPANAVTTVDGSASTGGVSLNMTGVTVPSNFAFTGGTGSDTLSLAAGAVASLGAGTQLVFGAGDNDKLSTADVTANFTAAWAARVNAMTGLETFGLRTGTAALDASLIPAIKRFSIDGTGTAYTISQVPASAQHDIGHDTPGAFAVTSLTLSPASGVSSTKINLGAADSTAAHSVTTLVLSGFTAVEINSNGVGPNLVGGTTLTNSDNSVFTVKGNAATTFGTLAATTIGNKIDGSAMTGALVAVGNTTAFSQGSSLGDTLIGGSAADTLTASKNYGILTGNGGVDTFNLTAAIGGVAATITKVTQITDAVKGESLILLAGGTSTFTSTENATCKAATTLAGVLNALAAGDGSTNGIQAWCTATAFDGNTYVVSDAGAGATFAATDIGVRLTGALDLSTASWTDGTATLVL